MTHRTVFVLAESFGHFDYVKSKTPEELRRYLRYLPARDVQHCLNLLLGWTEPWVWHYSGKLEERIRVEFIIMRARYVYQPDIERMFMGFDALVRSSLLQGEGGSSILPNSTE